MFRHKITPDEIKKESPKEPDKKPKIVVEVPAKPKTEMETIKDLLEKNLKWSQIIYEQNRKINNKLMWSAIGNWFRILLFVVPLIVLLWLLPSIISQYSSSYGDLLGGSTGTATTTANIPNSINQLMKTLPLSPAQQEQLKAIIK